MAARWAAKQRPPRQRDIETNYSYLAELLGVSRQVVQSYKARGRFPVEREKILIEASNGEITEEMLRA